MYEGRTSAKSGIVFGHENLGIVEDVGSTWGQFFGIHTSNDGRIMIFAGGIPLKRNGKVVGAIGVSGGSGEQDQLSQKHGRQLLPVKINSFIPCKKKEEK